MFKLLDFYADWCGPCKIMDPIMAEIEKSLANVDQLMRVLDCQADREQQRVAGHEEGEEPALGEDDCQADPKSLRHQLP